MSVFPSSKHIVSWAGLAPQCNESAGKKKSVHISRAGAYIKPILVQCANAAINDKKCPYFRHRYESIKKRRGHKRAIIAIARMLLTCVYNMLIKNEPFSHLMYEEYLERTSTNIPQHSIDKAIFLLQSQGFSVLKSDGSKNEGSVLSPNNLSNSSDIDRSVISDEKKILDSFHEDSGENSQIPNSSVSDSVSVTNCINYDTPQLTALESDSSIQEDISGIALRKLQNPLRIQNL